MITSSETVQFKEVRSFNERLIASLSVLQKSRVLPYVLLLTIVILASLLRFYKLGVWSLWIDEIYTINHARYHFDNFVEVVQNLPYTRWLPLSVIFTNISMKVLGFSELSARLTSALIGILSIPVLYFPIKKVFGVRSALIAVFLLSISPWHLFWSQNARFYTSLMLFYLLASFSFFFAIEYDRPQYIAVFYILFYFALSERLIAVFLLPVIFIYLGSLYIFPFIKPPGLNRKNLLILSLPLLLLFGIEIIHFLFVGDSLTSFLINDFGGKPFSNPPRLLISILFNLGLPIVSLGFFGGLYLVLKKSGAGLFFFLSAILPVLFIVILNPFMFTKDRYVFITLPSWIILVAVAVKDLISRTEGNGKIIASGVLVVLLAESAVTNISYYFVNNGDRRDWRSAFEIIKARSQSEDVVVAYWPEFSPFYLGREIIPWEDIRPQAVTSSGKRYWFLLDSETVSNNKKMWDWVIRNSELIEVLYLRMPESDFNLRIYLYDPQMNHKVPKLSPTNPSYYD